MQRLRYTIGEAFNLAGESRLSRNTTRGKKMASVNTDNLLPFDYRFGIDSCFRVTNRCDKRSNVEILSIF